MCRKYVVKCVQESNLHPLAYWSTALPVELVGQVTSNLLDSPFRLWWELPRLIIPFCIRGGSQSQNNQMKIKVVVYPVLLCILLGLVLVMTFITFKTF